MNIKRAAEIHEVMAKIGKPKPTKRPKTRRAPVAKRRKLLEKQIEDICRMIVFWRDGSVCCEANIDGVRCGGSIQWGHYIPRQQSNWQKYDLSNTYCQCQNHNLLHDRGAQTMATWFNHTFGVDVALAMEAERNEHRGGKKRTEQELEELLVEYDRLYQNRFYTDLTLSALVEKGYYGSVVRDAWRNA